MTEADSQSDWLRNGALTFDRLPAGDTCKEKFAELAVNNYLAELDQDKRMIISINTY